jgi:hypothetical protein
LCVSFVVALSMLGEELWVSPMLEGVASGTPLASGDGNYVFLTRNVGGGELFFTQQNNDQAPFAPPGIYHSPAEGYYDGGELNTNDILVWSVRPKPDDEAVGTGMTFVFQFPITFSGKATGLAYTILGTEARDFQAIQKPVFTNEGRSMYWGNSRSQFRCWVGQEGQSRYRFSRAPTSIASFTRGSPARISVPAPLAVTNNKTSILLFGGSASREFVRLNGDLTDQLVVATSGLVTTQAHVSPDDLFVYYVESGGRIHQASTGDLMDNWVFSIQAVQGEFALRNDGTVIFVADVAGTVQALQVAELPLDSLPPSRSQTMSPSKLSIVTGTPVSSVSPVSAPFSSAPMLVRTPGPVTPGTTSTPIFDRTPTPISNPTLAPSSKPVGPDDSPEGDPGDSDSSVGSDTSLPFPVAAVAILLAALVY